MKFNTIYTLCLAAFAMTACSEDIDLGGVGTENIEFPQGGVVYVTDAQGKRNFSTVEFRDHITSELNIHTQTPRATATAVKFQYDENVLTEYNRKNNTQYKALPANLVQFANDGVVTLEAGKTFAIAEYTLTSDGSLDQTETYVLPVRASVSSGDAQLGSVDATRLIYVRDLSGIPDCTKYVPGPDGELVPGVTVFSCMEVNDTNPLNNLSFTLGNEGVNKGKCLYDALIIFSANVNFNKETGRVYVFCNENVQALLDYRDKYLKPLQDRGIKIILGLLGNHDGAGIANLSEYGAIEYSKTLANAVKKYKLDGISFDDEYSNYGQLSGEWFESASAENASRLLYYTKESMKEIVPWDTYTMVYYYGNINSSLPRFNGVAPGNYVDIAVADYPIKKAAPMSGMTKKQCSGGSVEMNLGSGSSPSDAINIKNSGYGWMMWFSYNPVKKPDNVAALQTAAKGLYDGMKLMTPQYVYKKATMGTHNNDFDPNPYPFAW